MPKVIYLTGAPAAGKSTATRMLAQRVPELLVWEYGARLTEHIRAKSTGVVSQDDLRAQSSGLVTPDDITEVDRALVKFIEENRADHSVLIDSHPVTKEIYGYRVTPFSLEQFARIAPDEIWVLYAGTKETLRRIKADGAGRPMISEEEARLHTSLQASVAAIYGMTLGRPIYLFDTATPLDGLVTRLTGRFS